MNITFMNQSSLVWRAAKAALVFPVTLKGG
jgi:hypothetical protein